MSAENHYLGLSKTKFHSSVCLIPSGDFQKMQIWSTERLSRKKDSGAWPSTALKQMELWITQNNISQLKISENRDVETPFFFEEFYNEQFPFYEFLEKNNLKQYSSQFNPAIQFITHHEAHAYAALGMSPFEKSLIVVMDGAGNRAKEFSPVERFGANEDDLEECSVYLQNGPKLELVFKRFIRFEKNKVHPEHVFSTGIGYFYEKASEFIFNSSTSAGKVMGLAPLGKAEEVADRLLFQEEINWAHQFSGKTKKDWEESPFIKEYCDLAASVQQELENDYQQLLVHLKKKYPDYENLILTGGCALNCTNNAKIYDQKLFQKIYVPPFPGDESIGVGLACKRLYTDHPEAWKPLPFKDQVSYWGPHSSIPQEDSLIKILNEKKINFQLCEDVVESALADLLEGKIIGWFQGRSESGPRALGNRSILVRPDRLGIKDELNAKIKFREKFRPYGCSVIHEMAPEYFDVDSAFENPFMSYAIRVKSTYKKLLNEVSHVDGTSRMQTVRETQNPLFYKLLMRFGQKTNLYCLLNTSLNIMGEPIVETMEDALRFFESTEVDSMYIGKIKLLRHKC